MNRMMKSAPHAPGRAPDAPLPLGRRALLLGGALAGCGLLVRSVHQELRDGFKPVFIARQQQYDGRLTATIRDGLAATGLQTENLRGKRVLLKPNLVEPSRSRPFSFTHPALVIAAAEVFRAWGAEVVIGEGPGHLRDTEFALVESGLQEALDAHDLPFADLNYEEVGWRQNAGRMSRLPGLWLPRSVLEADLVVSLPKLKTHHWMGVTAALKNMYGVIPGIKYGWPKNVLHHAGIAETVVDINATLPKTITMVDGIECMEGDGPICGERKYLGVVLVGLVPSAVDATACRLMGVDPRAVPYLRAAEGRLGSTHEATILQRGEPWQPLASHFALPKSLRGMRLQV